MAQLRVERRQQWLAALLALALLALASCGGDGGGSGPPAVPAVPPNLSNATLTTNAFDHGDEVTISNGSNFGVKSSALPAVLDFGSGPSPQVGTWSGAWPSQDPQYNLAYRNLPGLSPPHGRINNNMYIAGAHYPAAGPFDAGAGPNVIFWKDRTIASYPAYTYASWYQRMDTGWVFQDGLTPNTDNNLKNFAFSVCCSPYELPNNWYISYHDGPHDAMQTSNWAIGDDYPPRSVQKPDQNGHPGTFWGLYVNPMAIAWSKIEVEIKYSRGTDGYIKMWENGILKINHRGYNDRLPGNQRTEGIGGFARSRNIANWRYFADVYLDYTPARVVLANNPVLSSATIVENQIPTAWSDTSITFFANLGKLSGQTAYLFVVNAAGLPNTPGVPVLVGN